jgi:DNA-binding beta-propeller fold protein YncE
VYVTGTTFTKYTTVAYDALSGTQKWIADFSGPTGHYDSATALALSTDGARLYVTGESRLSDDPLTTGYATVAYDAATGQQLWVSRYDGPGSRNQPLAIAVSSAAVFVTGQSEGVGDTGFEYATVAYDATSGDQLWARRYAGSGHGGNHASAIALSPDGKRVFVTGEASEASGDYATIAYKAGTGRQIWLRTYDGPNHLEDGATGLAVSPDGTSLYVTGSSDGQGFLTIGYEASSGTELWTAECLLDRADAIGAAAIGLSPAGETVYVTGVASGSKAKGNEYATAAYDAQSGAQLWASLFNGPRRRGGDAADALAVSPDGSAVYVTGSSEDLTRPPTYSFETLAYATS